MGSLTSSNEQHFRESERICPLKTGENTHFFPQVSKYTGFFVCLFAFEILCLLPTQQIAQLYLTLSEQGKLTQMGDTATQNTTSNQPALAFF